MQYFGEIFKDRKEVSVRYDAKYHAVWLYLNPADRPRYSLQMLKSILETQTAIKNYFKHSKFTEKFPIRFFVLTSQIKGIYNYGGAYFSKR